MLTSRDRQVNIVGARNRTVYRWYIELYIDGI